MKTLIFIASFLLPLLTFGFASAEKAEFKVYGACGMCEARIEKAANSVDGVTSADWNRETKMLTIQYDASKVNLDDVHKKIAEAGHDTDKVKANDETYNSLPACCHYERKDADKTGQLNHEGHQGHGKASGGGCCSR